MAHAGADAADFVGGHACPHAAAADYHAPLSLAARHPLGQRFGEVGVVVRRVDAVGADVGDLVAEAFEQLGEGGF